MPQIVVVRHAQSVFNQQVQLLGEQTTVKFNPEFVDSPITEIGRQQARKARGMPIFSKVRHLFVSPLRRAQQTAHILFQGRALISRQLLPLARQVFQSSCDIMDSVESAQALADQFGFKYQPSFKEDWHSSFPFDCVFDKGKMLEAMKEAWQGNGALQSNRMLRERAVSFKAKLKQLIDQGKLGEQGQVCVVTHSRFLQFLFARDFDKRDEPVDKVHFDNCAARLLQL